MAFLVVLIALVFDVLNRYEPIGIDFHTYLAAAVVGVQHGWSFIYDQSIVADAQKQLVSSQIAQPFLSPPPVAWLTAPLTPLPYWVAYWVWTAVNFVAFAGALVWASRKSGFERWLYAAGALAPWWVVHALNLGQVAPLVAAPLLLALVGYEAEALLSVGCVCVDWLQWVVFGGIASIIGTRPSALSERHWIPYWSEVLLLGGAAVLGLALVLPSYRANDAAGLSFAWAASSRALVALRNRSLTFSAAMSALSHPMGRTAASAMIHASFCCLS